MPGIKKLADRVVVVTGAGSGIGRASAHAFAKQGAIVVLADVSLDRAESVQKEIETLGGKAFSKQVDVAQQSEIAGLAEFVQDKFKRIDVLHNNAGVALSGFMEDLSLDDWRWIVDINFWGTVYGVDAFLPMMIRERQGHIVNTASILGLCQGPGTGPYACTKAAILALSQTLRTEVRRHNIGVTAICPGIINTRIVDEGRFKQRENAYANPKTVSDFYKRFGWKPERVANAVVQAVRYNRNVVPVGPEAWAQWYFKRFSNGLHDRFITLAGRYLLPD